MTFLGNFFLLSKMLCVLSWFENPQAMEWAWRRLCWI